MTHLLKSDFAVRDVPLAVVQDCIAKWHYTKGGANTATFRHGLFHRLGGECLGVAWWIPPTKHAAIANFPEGLWTRVLSLSRLAVHPELPTNAASFLIGASIRMIRKEGRWDCLLTYADEWQGHEGTIYKATNWEYRGRTSPEAQWVDEAGRAVARKAGPKTRTKAEMEALGFRMIGRFAKKRFRLVLR